MTDPVLDIGWIVIAFAAGLGARTLRLPPLVGYLAAGIGLAAIGVDGSAVINAVGEVGVALVLFLVGMDLRWKNLSRAEVLGGGGLHLALVGGLGMGVGVLFGLSPTVALVVGLSFSVPSLILAATTLQAQHDLRAFHGRVAIGIILLQTVVATAAIATLGSLPSLWAISLLGLPLLRPLLTRVLDLIDHDQMFLLCGLALAALGHLLFSAVGVSPELGALAAGALVAGHDQTEEIASALEGIKDAGLAAFFLGVGLVGVPGGWGLGLVAGLVGALLIKGLLFFGVLTAFRLKARTAFLAALPLTTYSGFTLIVGDAAVRAGGLPESALTVFALATALSYLVNAPLARHAPRWWRRLESVLTSFERSGRHPEDRPQTLGHAQYLVVGMGRAGTAAYDYLTDMQKCTVGLDVDPGRLERHRRAGRRVTYGDARDASLWVELDLGSVEAVILTIPDQHTKIEAIQALRRAGFQGAISALTTDPDRRGALMEAGANAVYLSVEQAGQALAAFGLRRRSDPIPTTATLSVTSEDR